MNHKLTPQGKRLLILFAITPLLCLLVHYGSPYLHPQTRNLKAIRKHIQKIYPQWEQFRIENRGFEQVTLWDYTGGDGMFAAYGSVPSDQHIEQLRIFLESTSPPRPITLHAVMVIEDDFIETNKVAKPEGSVTNPSRK